MNKRTKSEYKKINTILRIVCKNESIKKEEVYSMFKSKDQAIAILNELHENGYIKITRIYQDDGVYAISKTEKTCLGIKNQSSSRIDLIILKTIKAITQAIKKAIWELSIGVIIMIIGYAILKYWLKWI